MLKRIISAWIAIVLVFVFTIPSFSMSQDNYICNTETPSATQKISKEISDTKAPEPIDVRGNSEYLDALYNVPVTILEGTTEKLLKYFLESQYVAQSVFAISSNSIYDRNIDFSSHPAYAELVRRGDLKEVLEQYRNSLSSKNIVDDRSNIILDALINQPTVNSMLNDDMATLSTIEEQSLANATNSLEIGDYAFTLNGIDYYYAGTEESAGGNSVPVYRRGREWNATEIGNINDDYDYNGNTLIDDASTTYNCHSYAWYDFTASNPYWIANISPYQGDSTVTFFTDISMAQENDIIVYYRSDNYPLHSGVVSSTADTLQDFVIESKWGQAGAYLHKVFNVPEGYFADPDNGVIRYGFFRYHDFTSQYTGENYHSGNMHYYRYVSTCEVCGETNYYTQRTACSGPPCAIYMSNPSDEEQY